MDEQKKEELHQELALLTSEWCYLTHPSRIRQLIQHHLPDWVPLTKEHILSPSDFDWETIPNPSSNQPPY